MHGQLGGEGNASTHVQSSPPRLSLPSAPARISLTAAIGSGLVALRKAAHRSTLCRTQVIHPRGVSSGQLQTPVRIRGSVGGGPKSEGKLRCRELEFLGGRGFGHRPEVLTLSESLAAEGVHEPAPVFVDSICSGRMRATSLKNNEDGLVPRSRVPQPK